MQQYHAINTLALSTTGIHHKQRLTKICPKCRKELVARTRKKEFQNGSEETTIYWRHKQGDAYLCRNQK